MIEVEAPDGSIIEFPAGTDDATIDRVMRQNFAPETSQSDQGSFNIPSFPGNQPQQSGNPMGAPDWMMQAAQEGYNNRNDPVSQSLNDMAKAGAAGVARGATELADLPQTVLGLGASLGSGTAEMLGLASPEEAQRAEALVSGLIPARTGQDQSARELAADVTGGATEFRGDTTAGQYAGTVGEFIPGSLLGGGSMMTNAAKYGVVPGLASEAAGQATEGTPLEPAARTVAALLASGGMSAATRPQGAKAPTTAALKQQADDLYQAGNARAGADVASVRGLKGQINGVLQQNNIITPTGRVLADGNVKKFLDVIDDFDGQAMAPAQMQNARKFLTDAAKSSDPSDRRIGSMLLGEFDNWRGQHVPEFKQADQLYGRMKRAEDVDFRIEKADRRAASSGTGGNSVNTARQNIRQILDNPKARRGYTEDEILAMERIVRGDPMVNTLRLGGRLSPTSGALPLMGNIVGTGVNPVVGALMMGGTYGMKSAAEALTNKQISGLSELIRNGAAIPARESQSMQAIISALLGANAGQR